MPGHGHDVKLGTGTGDHHLSDEKDAQDLHANVEISAEPCEKGGSEDEEHSRNA